MRTLFLLGLLAAPTAYAGPVSLTAGYHGDFVTHPGGYVGARYEAAEAGAFSFSVGGDLGGYHHERNHTGLFARANVATRLTSTGGLFVEPRFTAGYVHTFVDGDGYWVVDEQTGQVRQKLNGGSAGAMYGLGVGLGAELGGKAEGLTIVVRPEILGRAPFNSYSLSQFSLQAGVEWRFGGDR